MNTAAWREGYTETVLNDERCCITCGL